MQDLIFKETDTVELLAARLAEKYGVNFDYKLFEDGVFVSKNGLFAVIKHDMTVTEIDIAMRRIAQKARYLYEAENSEKTPVKPRIKDDAFAVACLGTAASVSGAGIASSGSAVAGSALWGGLVAVPFAPALLTAGLIGGGVYFGRRRLKQAYDKFVPQEHKDKIEGFISGQARETVAKAQKYLAEAKQEKDD